MKKQWLLFAASGLLAAMASAGCSSSSKTTIGILQPVEHPALDKARLGFVEKLAELGFGSDKVEFVYDNAGGKAAELNAFAKDLAGRCDMTFGLGTDAAVALKSAAIDKGRINPVLFSAVTDPVDAGLVTSLDNGTGFVTGTSDINPVEAQISLIKDCIPDADKVGILYTQSETNSGVQAELAEAEIAAEGMEYFVQTATGPSDITAAVSALTAIEGLDAIYLPTDNNIAANTSAVKSAVQGKGILVVAGEESMLKNCGSITLSVDYDNLGRMTGAMAASILSKEKTPAEIPVGFMAKDECEYLYSSANAAAAGIELPPEIIAKCRDVAE